LTGLILEVISLGTVVGLAMGEVDTNVVEIVGPVLGVAAAGGIIMTIIGGILNSKATRSLMRAVGLYNAELINAATPGPDLDPELMFDAE
jgi:hypothetical protein